MVLRRSLCRESGVGSDEVVRVRRKLKRGRLFSCWSRQVTRDRPRSSFVDVVVNVSCLVSSSEVVRRRE